MPKYLMCPNNPVCSKEEYDEKSCTILIFISLSLSIINSLSVT